MRVKRTKHIRKKDIIRESVIQSKGIKISYVPNIIIQ